MTRRYRPVEPAALRESLTDLITSAVPVGSGLRVAVDGPTCARPADFASALLEPLRASGRPAVVLRAEAFWKDAALRLEHGHEDADAYLDWLDAPALRREVLGPLGAGGNGQYLPSLRDPVTNRATREPPVTAVAGTVVLVAGSFLLGLGLPFDVAIHLAVSPGARARGTDPELAWTLPAFDRYDDEVQPVTYADAVVRIDDPHHPAVAFG